MLNGLTIESQTAINGLIAKNIVATPIQKENIVKNSSGSVLSKNTQRTNFKIWPNSGIVLPEIIQTAKDVNLLEDRIQYHDYYANGNLKEVSLKNGAHIIYLWGYNQTQPIAKIENATSTQISAALGVSDVSDLNESNLSSINALRNNISFTNSMITTYTYVPLVGVSSITDPRGDTITYTYDSFGRLQFVKDKDGNILSENQYNYKQ